MKQLCEILIESHKYSLLIFLKRRQHPRKTKFMNKKYSRMYLGKIANLYSI